MKLIVGLGNPGTKYEKTRHNIGFMVVEKFLKDFEPVRETVWVDDKKFKSDIAQIEWQPRHGDAEKVILAKPKTYMNNSGLAVQLLTTYYSPRGTPRGDAGEAGKLLTTDIWIVHDDIDLQLGDMKIRFGGGSAGHKGIDSVIEKLGTDKFWRFRMGIGVGSQKSEVRSQKLKNVEDYVLGKFTGKERGKIRELIKRGVKAIEMGLERGLEAAMNRFNTK